MGISHRIALNSWTLDTTPLTQLPDIAREAGFLAIEVRSVDFKRVDDPLAAAALVRNSGLAISSLGADGILVRANGREQDEWYRGLEDTTLLAEAIGCDTIMVSTGMENQTTIAAAAEILATAGEIAGKAGLRIAYEFNAFHPSIASLPAALDLLAAAHRPNIGLALDSYHLQRSGGSQGLEAIPADRLFCVQISDVPSAAGEQRAPLDRLPPGEGLIDWRRLFSYLDESNYGGFVAFEAPNSATWSKDPRRVAADGLARIVDLWEQGG